MPMQARQWQALLSPMLKIRKTGTISPCPLVGELVGCHLNVFLLTPWFPNRPDGWPAPFIADSAGALAAMGHRVSVTVLRGFVPPLLGHFAPPEHRGRIDQTAFSGLDSLDTRYFIALPRGRLRRWTNLLLDFVVRHAVLRAVHAGRPDVLLVHTESIAPSAVKTARALGLPVIVVLHGENTNHDYLTGGQQAQRFQTALSAADRLVIVGEPLRAYAARLAGRENHLTVVWNGVRPPERLRVIPDPDSNPLELITVASIPM